MSEDLGTWTINYLPPEGGRFTGKLTVGEDKLVFKSLYESSNATIVKAIFIEVSTYAAAGGHNVYRYSNDDEATVELPVGDIVKVESAKRMLMKRVIITMKDDQEFTFDYGLLSVKKLVASIQSLLNAP